MLASFAPPAATFAFLAQWRGRYVPEEPGAWVLLAALALVSTFIPVLTLALGIKRIGASKAALVSFIGPVSTAVLAWLILGEEMDLVQLAGMGLVIAGVLAISFDKSGKGRT